MQMRKWLDRRGCCVICTVGESVIAKGGTGSVNILEHARGTRVLIRIT